MHTTGLTDSGAGDQLWGANPAADVRCVMRHVLHHYSREQQGAIATTHPDCATAMLAVACSGGPSMRDVVHWVIARGARVNGLVLPRRRRKAGAKKAAARAAAAAPQASEQQQQAAAAAAEVRAGAGASRIPEVEQQPREPPPDSSSLEEEEGASREFIRKGIAGLRSARRRRDKCSPFEGADGLHQRLLQLAGAVAGEGGGCLPSGAAGVRSSGGAAGEVEVVSQQQAHAPAGCSADGMSNGNGHHSDVEVHVGSVPKAGVPNGVAANGSTHVEGAGDACSCPEGARCDGSGSACASGNGKATHACPSTAEPMGSSPSCNGSSSVAAADGQAAPCSGSNGCGGLDWLDWVAESPPQQQQEEEEEEEEVVEEEGDLLRYVLSPLVEAAAAGDRYLVELLIEVIACFDSKLAVGRLSTVVASDVPCCLHASCM